MSFAFTDATPSNIIGGPSKLGICFGPENKLGTCDKAKGTEVPSMNWTPWPNITRSTPVRPELGPPQRRRHRLELPRPDLAERGDRQGRHLLTTGSTSPVPAARPSTARPPLAGGRSSQSVAAACEAGDTILGSAEIPLPDLRMVSRLPPTTTPP